MEYDFDFQERFGLQNLEKILQNNENDQKRK